MEKNIHIEISNKKISYDSFKFIMSDYVGAVVSFVGIVKKNNNKKIVHHILYDVFDELMINYMKNKCLYFINNDLNAKFCIIQYKGILNTGEINLLISVGTEHRKKAFFYCETLLEFLKKNAPVWKKEFYIDGTSIWINSLY